MSYTLNAQYHDGTAYFSSTTSYIELAELILELHDTNAIDMNTLVIATTA